MTLIVFGTESELVIARSAPSGTGQMLIPAETAILERLLAIGADLYGVRTTSLGRVQLMDGAMLYVDGPSLEYATPPCLDWNDVALHERDLDYLIGLIVSAYEQEYGEKLTVYQPGSGAGGELCGYHENYGLCHEDYFQLFSRTNFRPTSVWLRVIVPFLVTRILFTGAGGIRNGGFCISPRASAVTHVFHHSTSPERPIVHLKRPQLGDDFLRVQITCGDANRALFATRLKISATSLILLSASRGVFDGLDLSLADPVAAMHDLSQDPMFLLPLSDGRQLSGSEIQRVLSERVSTCWPPAAEAANDPQALELLNAFSHWRETS